MLQRVKDPKVANIVDIHVGGKVRLRRTMLGMSQEKLGAALGVTFQQVQKYEKGTNRVGASRLQAIATTLHVPVSYFFEDVGDGSAGETAGTDERIVRETMLSREGITLMRCLAAIRSPSVKTKLISLAKALAADRPDEDEPVPAEARASQPA
jgi:transcriptional regulator with XRE-family HTH domain